VFNTFLGGGLLALHLGVGSASKEWRSPYRAPTFVVGFYFLANVFLMLAPLVRPPPWYKIYEHLPYWVRLLTAKYEKLERLRGSTGACGCIAVYGLVWDYVLVCLVSMATT
jgi:hypothetical protein